jgi:hypothetical protein
MISANVRFSGFSAREWARLALVFGRASAARSSSSEGGIIAVAAGRSLRKLVHTRRGRLEKRDHSWPLEPEELATQHSTAWAAVLQEKGLEELMNRFARELRPEHDLTRQLFDLVDGFRELERGRMLKTWPWGISRLSALSETSVRWSLDALCPKGRALVLGVFHGQELFTSLLLGRGQDGFDQILGPQALRKDMGLLSGDFRRDYRHLLEAAGRHSRVALGCFGELPTFQGLRSGAPGAFAQAVLARDIILHPAPAAISLGVGLDVGRAGLFALKTLVDQARSDFDPLGLLRKLTDRRGEH